jgi:hypothetical protein
MVRFASARWAAALLLFVLAGCSASADDGAGTSEGAATVAPDADAHAQASLAGNYNGHMTGSWDGALAITNASPERFDFGFEISPDDLDVAPVGHLDGTALLQSAGHYRYVDGDCTIDFQQLTDRPGARPGDLAVTANLTCAVSLAIDGHLTSSTALDFTATWHRY